MKEPLTAITATGPFLPSLFHSVIRRSVEEPIQPRTFRGVMGAGGWRNTAGHFSTSKPDEVTEIRPAERRLRARGEFRFRTCSSRRLEEGKKADYEMRIKPFQSKERESRARFAEGGDEDMA